MSKRKVLQVHPKDNVLVALQDLQKGDTVTFGGNEYVLKDTVRAKHKFVTKDLETGGQVFMYGVLVGKAKQPIAKGEVINLGNLAHAASDFTIGERHLDWHQPDTTNFEGKHFMGYHRSDGRVGTANYWLVIPLVFCENKNLGKLEKALVEDLGYGKTETVDMQSVQLIDLYKNGKSVEEILSADLAHEVTAPKKERLFKNVDGIRFLSHTGGCGSTREDSDALCGLLAGYITHPNVAGATVLSLGCQHAQASILKAEIKKRAADFDKPLYILEQQKIGVTETFLSEALKQTFAGLMQANQNERQPASLSKLCIGLECGASDGFSGISANPAIGYTSDLIVAMGGSVILSEFPELCGVEQNLSDRCVDQKTAERFSYLMKTYNDRAVAVGSGFDMNPSPGNIRDGLITDAIKSAGAAKKGGTSPVTDVLDYPERQSKPGLNLLCTPGSDVESCTAEVGAGANIVLFTTGLGTPTGNPVAPVIKLATNTALAEKMPDIIDINTGTVIEGEETIEQAGARILDYVIDVASGRIEIAAERNRQYDFIPWKRGVSL
ncbi:UxaA family hydrolase [Arachidicoccus terrestris]|uniref:UxaA family hydrolase n=1 Tax=Arachidicoccus terrestris TaxID=2875539 RepID=UPI001CC429AD|nr:altronate dehydratase family protein [Arachidicoccus terrestris]UAY54515.1 altronate dehydratase family protein [Arachidicoccus terrestris]